MSDDYKSKQFDNSLTITVKLLSSRPLLRSQRKQHFCTNSVLWVKLAKMNLAVSSEGQRWATQVTHQPSVRQQPDTRICQSLFFFATSPAKIWLLEWKITSSQRPVTCHLAGISWQTFCQPDLVCHHSLPSCCLVIHTFLCFSSQKPNLVVYLILIFSPAWVFNVSLLLSLSSH